MSVVASLFSLDAARDQSRAIRAAGRQEALAADEEAQAQEQQAALAEEEAFIEAERVETANRKFKGRQQVQFLKSGVSLRGSPLLVLKETEEEGAKEVAAIRKRGTALRGVAEKRAGIVRGRGRAALLGSRQRAKAVRTQARIGVLEGALSDVKTFASFGAFGVPIGTR